MADAVNVYVMLVRPRSSRVQKTQHGVQGNACSGGGGELCEHWYVGYVLDGGRLRTTME